jgi:hypothetical protein
MRTTNGIPLGSPHVLPIDTVNCVQTLKAHKEIFASADIQFSKGMKATPKQTHRLTWQAIGSIQAILGIWIKTGTVRAFRQKVTLEECH